MKTLRDTIIAIVFMGGMAVIATSCLNEDPLNVPVKQTNVDISSSLDTYIEENYTKEYGMAIRYRFVDQYIGATRRATPPKEDMVIPMLDFIQEFWIDPYVEVNNGEVFFRDHVPAEIIFLGGPLFNEDGTITLGTADAGAQITLTNVNALDLADTTWRDLQLNTIYHEFAHIVHQLYRLPPAYETISPNGYTSPGSWFILTDEDALMRGFVSPYATSSPNEDFAEHVAYFTFYQDFDQDFVTDEANCQDADCVSRNEGRELIRQKMAAIESHYRDVTGVDLADIRNAVQTRVN